MKLESLPHIPQSVALNFDELLNKDFKLVQASDSYRLGYRLMDLALLALKSQEKVKVLITDSTVLDLFILRAKEVGLNPKSHSQNSIYLEWSEGIYPSQKILSLDRDYKELNRLVAGRTLIESMVMLDFPKAIRSGASLVNTSLTQEVLDRVGEAHVLYNPLIDSAKIEQLIVKEGLNFDTLRIDIQSIQSTLDQIYEVLNAVNEISLDATKLRRMNHSSSNPVVKELYRVYYQLDEAMNDLTQLNCEPLKKPLNAAVLTTYLEAQVVDWRHYCHLLSNPQVIEWLRVVDHLPWDIARNVWDFAKVKIEQPWAEILIRQRGSQEFSWGEFTSTPMKFLDSQHLLRVLIGNVEERIEVVFEDTLLNPEEKTLTLIPDHLHDSVVNPLRYEVVTTIEDLPLLNTIHTGPQLNDSQLLSNATIISSLLANRVSTLSIYLNRSRIIISTLSRDQEVLDFFAMHHYEKVKLNNLEEHLKECLIDVNRKVGILVIGSLISLGNVSDWVYQMQLLEVIKATGIEIIDVPIKIVNGKDTTLSTSITSTLSDYVGS